MTLNQSENTGGLPESRFFMWRAIFAMAHADHVVTDDERAFMENYLNNVPFSPVQKDILREDMAAPQNAGEMFSLITEPEDRGTFFQFARELVWCDGDLAAQEEVIKECLQSGHMAGLNVSRLEVETSRSVAEARMQRTAEGRRMEEDADDVLGLASFLRKMIGRKA